jgi:hypothetical protein
MMLALAFVALLSLPAAVLAGNGNTPLASIPIEFGNDYHLYVQARANGSVPLRCGIDSGGGNRSYLDRQKAATLGIQATAQGRSGGPQASGMTVDERARVTWELGGLKLPDTELILQNRPYADFNCGIGLGVLLGYVVEVDYDAAMLRVYDATKYEPSDVGQAIPFATQQGTPFVTVGLAFGKGEPLQARLAVDTGGGRPAAYLSKSFIDSHALMPQVAKTVPEFSFGFASGQPKMLAARLEKLSVGPVELTRPIVHLSQVRGFGGGPEPDGMLCPDFLRRFKVVFDYPRQRLLLERGRHFGDDMPFDASGTIIYGDGQNGYRVLRVVEGSPAAEAGLRPGDVILEIDGKTAGQLSNNGIAAVLRQAGREIAIRIQRGEEKQSVSLKLRNLL